MKYIGNSSLTTKMTIQSSVLNNVVTYLIINPPKMSCRIDLHCTCITVNIMF